MKIKLGTYTGNGSDNRAISSIGFQPDVVMVKGVSKEACIRTATMAGDNTKPSFVTDAALAADHVQSLDSDGFTIGTAAPVNTNLTVYYWLAIQDSSADCKLGTYTGNGGATQVVTGVGFQPTMVLIIPANTDDPVFLPTSLDAAGTSAATFASSHTNDLIASLDADGFTVGTNRNTSGQTYHYVAFKDQAGVFGTFTYTGNGSDNRDIDISTGYTPQFALTKGNSVSEPTLRFKDHAGDSSTAIAATFGNFANGIQSFRANGIQVGTDTWSNANTVRYDGWWMVESTTDTDGGGGGGLGHKLLPLLGVG